MTDNQTLTLALNAHYAPEDVSNRILAAVRVAGLDPQQLSRDAAALFDEFHGGGRESTRTLARAVGLASGQRILDVGCGVGGPARTLCAEFGCEVTGVDLTHQFIVAAKLLSERVGMADAVTFLHGSALALPVPDGSFDWIWSQNMLMNIPDKLRFAQEMRRVLKPGGRCAIEAVVAGTGDIFYPCFWATEPALSFVVTPEELRATFTQAGLQEQSWVDTTALVLAQGRRRLAGLLQEVLASDAAPTPLGIGVLVPDRVLDKTRNALRNNEEGRTRTIQTVWLSP